MGTADVRFGSKADATLLNFDVRFTPEGGHCRRGQGGSPEKAAIEALVVGIIATLATDLWLWLLQIVGVPPANWALVGRWVAWMPRGVFVHRPIAATPSIRGELAIGWATVQCCRVRQGLNEQNESGLSAK